MIYGLRSNGNRHGLVLTKPVVVKAMLERVGYTSHRDLSNLKVIDPAAGAGAFSCELVERLFLSSQKFGFSFQNALLNLKFFEIDKEMVLILKERIDSLLIRFGAFTPKGLIHEEDFLLSEIGDFDLVIGNPPYVRYENIPEDKKNLYRKSFNTFRHRSDLYIAFYEKSLRSLKDGGILSFICSNRWLKNQYGHGLRNLIQNRYFIEEIIDLEDASPFEEDVLAYPAITTIINSKINRKTQYYTISDESDIVGLEKASASKRILNINNSRNWFSSTAEGKSYEKFLESIENQGFKIGIGVATGLDKVFIRKDFKSLVENDLLLPIILSKDLKNNELKWSGNYILNPYEVNGNLIELDKYPVAKKYLELNRDQLLKRHISSRNPKFWYKTIDKIYPNLTYLNKILLPDISGNTQLIIDKGGYYPHHNIYYITHSDLHKLEILAALLMSDFVRNQLLEFGTKMNGGYARWQSYHLKKLRVPKIDSLPIDISTKLRIAYNEKNFKLINHLITPDHINEFGIEVGQMSLFES